MADETKKASYTANYKDKCWYDDCSCPDVLPGDCDRLAKENNEGIGRFACVAGNQDCYDKNFFKRAFQKIACQFEHIIQNICALWDVIYCLAEYLAPEGDNRVAIGYYRNSSVDAGNFYKPLNSGYAIRIFKDSIYGWDSGDDIDDKRRETFDQEMHCFIRWCADGNELEPTQDNTMEFLVRHSGEPYSDDMKVKRGIHWQMTGLRDGAMPCSDTLFLPKGEHIVIEVIPANNSAGLMRVHNIKVEYTPVGNRQAPECLKALKKPKAENK